ncbi:hypothetical protein CLV51_103126 [Chitinophaga niastensis]|uniref:YD repeat-containing protein n=1 Tax=Chitinophaga niastensis TaxID=536980 RepID=A0A2P8HIZ4_CHINA|nr:hypothetical protein [Chitinophaga niastensis]PSL46150.1 hypothetical protein CLV51_103126 [Chitinophaga niastensis]
MHNKSITRRVSVAMLMASVVVFSAFRSDYANGGEQSTYLHKISSPAGQTILEYNADKTIRKIVQQHKTENASYSDVQLPVYENGRLVKTLFSDNEQASTGDIYTSFVYGVSGNKIEKVSYYRNNAVYTYDSLVYDAAGKMALRYQFSKNAAKGNNWENTGYQQYTWDADGDIATMATYGKQPGYSKFVLTSSIGYTYDNKQNPQQQQPELASMLDATAANLSAHNILTESISSPNSSRVITNTYTYAYNAGKYPVRATFNSGMDATIVKLEWVKL